MLTVKTYKQGNFFKAKARWVLRGLKDKQKEYQQTDSLASAKWQPARVETFFTLIWSQQSSMDSLILWIVMLCVNCHHKQVILLFFCCEIKNLLVAWMMLLDAGGAFWTKHCVVMVWLPRDLTDVVMCCAQPKRVSQIGTKGALRIWRVQLTSHSNRVRDLKEMQHLRGCWIPFKEAQLQTNPWQESKTFL